MMMATSKKSVFVEAELEWAEEQLLSWKAYVDANPLHELKDRLSYKETKTGGMIPMVVASIEQQGKFVQDTMKNYLALLKEVELMRSQEEAKKIASRGDKELSIMEDGTI
jgi:hypothetical protein